jgi:Ca2+-binding RTX toxin-like protein
MGRVTVEHWDPVTHTYFFGSDQVLEVANEGYDTVISTVTYTLPDNVERLTLNGFGNIDGYGNNLDNELIGGPGANRLEGFAGDDTYVVNHSGDQVIEASAQGNAHRLRQHQRHRQRPRQHDHRKQRC